MNHKLERVQQLETRARAAPTLAEAQALTEEADRLRGARRVAATTGPVPQPLIRN